MSYEVRTLLIPHHIIKSRGIGLIEALPLEKTVAKVMSRGIVTDHQVPALHEYHESGSQGNKPVDRAECCVGLPPPSKSQNNVQWN